MLIVKYHIKKSNLNRKNHIFKVLKKGTKFIFKKILKNQLNMKYKTKFILKKYLKLVKHELSDVK